MDVNMLLPFGISLRWHEALICISHGRISIWTNDVAGQRLIRDGISDRSCSTFCWCVSRCHSFSIVPHFIVTLNASGACTFTFTRIIESMICFVYGSPHAVLLVFDDAINNVKWLVWLARPYKFETKQNLVGKNETKYKKTLSAYKECERMWTAASKTNTWCYAHSAYWLGISKLLVQMTVSWTNGQNLTKSSLDCYSFWWNS